MNELLPTSLACVEGEYRELAKIHIAGCGDRKIRAYIGLDGSDLLTAYIGQATQEIQLAKQGSRRVV